MDNKTLMILFVIPLICMLLFVGYVAIVFERIRRDIQESTDATTHALRVMSSAITEFMEKVLEEKDKQNQQK